MIGIIKVLAEKSSLVLCSYVIDELHETVNSKFGAKTDDIERFLSELPFEYVYTPHNLPPHGLFSIRDSDDEKVLYSAIVADVDILITGDKDFYDVDIEHPEILSPAAFIKRF
jgi:predicted nucleic acid-binding protein